MRQIKEEGASVTAGIAGTGSQTDMSEYAPENMVSLVSPLFEKLNAAKLRWGEVSLQERVNSAKARWKLEERSNISRIKVEDHEDATDYEKERTKTINARIKANAEEFKKAQDSRLIKDADLRDVDYIDGQIDSFLKEYLTDKA
jgi:hypothetical protein